MLQFPHLQNSIYNSAHPHKVLGRLNEVKYVKRLPQSLVQKQTGAAINNDIHIITNRYYWSDTTAWARELKTRLTHPGTTKRLDAVNQVTSTCWNASYTYAHTLLLLTPAPLFKVGPTSPSPRSQSSLNTDTHQNIPDHIHSLAPNCPCLTVPSECVLGHSQQPAGT